MLRGLVTPRATFPITLLTKKKLTLAFTATFNCANDPAAGASHKDFRTVATVHHEAIDGKPDSHTADDSCPHAPIGVDPNPDGSIKDAGCGGKNPDGTLGADVLTDVVVR